MKKKGKKLVLEWTDIVLAVGLIILLVMIFNYFGKKETTIIDIQQNRGSVTLTDRQIFNQAQKNYRESKIKKAIIDYEKLVRLHPESEYLDDTYFQLGKCYGGRKLKEWNKAIGYYRKIVKDFPDSPLRGEAQHKIAMTYADGLKEHEQALSEYRFLKYNIIDYPKMSRVDYAIKALEYDGGTGISMAERMDRGLPDEFWEDDGTSPDF